MHKCRGKQVIEGRQQKETKGLTKQKAVNEVGVEEEEALERK